MSKKEKKPFTITADLFNNPYLTGLMDFLAFVSPAKTVNEKAIREDGRKKIAAGDLGAPVERKPANLNGRLDRDRILKCACIFGNVPEVTENDIKLISDAGFDMVLNGNSGEYGKRISDWCLKYDLAVLGEDYRQYVSENDIDTSNGENIFEGYKPHPASVGDCWCDEPNARMFNDLSKFQQKYNKANPDRLLFINLLPGGAVKSAWCADNYIDYVDRYSKTVKDDYISLDIYPFHPSMILNKFEMMLTLHTYSTIANACRRDGKDFWLYIQTQMRWFSHLYTYTTYEMIKWQCYASMCYGCRCILHASYNPVWGDEAIGIIDRDGNLTEQYLYVKSVNEEIEKLSPVIKDYRSLGVELTDSKKHNPHFVLAGPKQKKDNKLFCFKRIPEVVSVTSESTALAGYFENAEHKKAIMIVDCKNIRDPYCSQNIKIKLSSEFNVSIYEKGVLVKQAKTDLIDIKVGSCDGIYVTLD